MLGERRREEGGGTGNVGQTCHSMLSMSDSTG